MSEQPGRNQSDGRPRGGQQNADLISDLQRWLLRSSARNMRDQIGDQVRRTFNSPRPQQGDVWDVATTEPPPDGEAPECQWCPICRAARRMRETGPGFGDQLSGVGDAVAAAVQDAAGALDSLLGRASGRDRAGPPGRQGPPQAGSATASTRPAGADPWDTATSPADDLPERADGYQNGSRGRS